MSSYFDYYCSNLENNSTTNTPYIRGTCRTMCPQDEIKLREWENMVHVLEVWGSERKLVKSFSRSAADSNMAIPKLLRPFHVLSDTVKFLLLEVLKRTDVPTSVVYDYVTDRLRAVRQDMTIQRLSPKACVKLLDPMVRFHVYYGYKLLNYPLKDYDPVLNKKYLLECMKWCLNCWDMIPQNKNRDDVDELSRFVTTLKIEDTNTKLPCDRVLMESLYILCNLDNVHPLIRYLSLPKELKKEPMLQMAGKVGMANLKQNYMQVGRALDTECPLSYCALYTHLPELQRLALVIMSHAYNNKRFTVPCDQLKQWLRLSSNNEVREICKHYGLELVGDAVRFGKGDFKSEVAMHQLEPRKINGKLDLSIDNIFLYKTNEE